MFSNIIFKSALSEEDCDTIVKECERLLTLETSGISNDAKIETESRKSKSAFLSMYNPTHLNIWQTVSSRIWAFVNLANRSGFGFDATYLDEIQYAQYDVGDFYKWHKDLIIETDNAFQRKLSVSVQLSDPDTYEGGELEMQGLAKGHELPQNVLRKRGTVIVFPSFCVHRITPVTKGTRKSLVAWVEGKKWR
jgi:PKHD-type hydroxylase